MKVIALKGEERSATGKSLSKKLRKEGKVPCVVYGTNENRHFSVYQADFKNLVYTPNTYLVQIKLGEDAKLAKIQELQFHPVSEEIMHADFYEVDTNKPVKIAVPVNIVGNAPGVRAGGHLELKIKKLSVEGMIQDLPESIDVNIDDLELGKSIKVKDISANNLTLLDSDANSIVSCNITRAAKSAGLDDEEGEEGDESAEGAEGAEGEGGEGGSETPAAE
ncbi:MAG: 50S ribosomal protein L25 [Bacteroidia bacterium]